MQFIFIILLSFCFLSCQQVKNKEQPNELLSGPQNDPLRKISYDQIRDSITAKRKQFAVKYPTLNESGQKEITDYWVNAICNDLFNKWQNTPWDFNGTTSKPQQGSIACGYFVTAILRDMDLPINRVKLSVCASSQMMKGLTPNQPLKNLSCLSYEAFNDRLKEFGKGVYIIGLDFHTGFIVNDGNQTWFIHSNYIGRKGVTKEPVMNSAALKSSKTRWMISLTNDNDFLQRWLRG